MKQPELTPEQKTKLEREVEQSRLKTEWLEARLKGEPFVRQAKFHNSDGAFAWTDLQDTYLEWYEGTTYRRKPEPTLAERNAALVQEYRRHKEAGEKVEFWECVRGTEYRVFDDALATFLELSASREGFIKTLPEPQYRAFTFATCPSGCEAEAKVGKHRGPFYCTAGYVALIGHSATTYAEALDKYWLIREGQRVPFGEEVKP